MIDQNDDPLDVVVLVFDSIRARALGTYGGPVDTPWFDRLAELGTTFDQAYAVGDNTAISHGVLFSGQYPTETGVVNSSHRYADIEDPVMASQFRANGYDTTGIVGGGKLSRTFGFDEGFDEYLEIALDIPDYLSGEYLKEVITNSDLRWPLVRHFLRTAVWGVDHTTGLQFEKLHQSLVESDDPALVFSNLLTAHTPYNPPRPWKEEAEPSIEHPRWFFLEVLLNREEQLTEPGIDGERVYHAQTTDGIAKYYDDTEWLSDAELDVLESWYHASIRYADRWLEWFLDTLADEGRLDETVIVVTSDHGEHFGEHDRLRHGFSWYDDCLSVPLIVAGPDVPAGKRRTDFVSLVDVFDTACDLAGLDQPETTTGQSIFGDERRSAAFSEHGRQRGEGAASKYMTEEERELFNRGWKVVRTDEFTYVLTSDGTQRLYDRPDETLVTDPPEDILQSHRQLIADELSTEFRWGWSEEPDIAEEVKESLRNLGYVE